MSLTSQEEMKSNTQSIVSAILSDYRTVFFFFFFVHKFILTCIERCRKLFCLKKKKVPQDNVLSTHYLLSFFVAAHWATAFKLSF